MNQNSMAVILLVEDNPGDVRLLQEAFRECGFAREINVTRDGEQALMFLRHEGPYGSSPRPTLILLDLNLPRKDGREVLAAIKDSEELRRIPVMILSISTRPEDIARAYDLHANCYIPKPADLEALVQIGRQIQEFWLRTVALPA